MSSRVLFVLIGALGAGVLLGQLFPVPPSSTLPRPASTSAIGSDVIDFELTVHDGSTLYASDLREKALLVFFGYTHCPDICPTTLVEMAAVKRALGPTSSNFRGLFITVDPERDTPERLATYVNHFDDELLGLTGSAQQIATAAKAFGAAYERGDDVAGGGYLMGHSGFGYLVAPGGTLYAVFPTGTPADEIEASVRALVSADG